MSLRGKTQPGRPAGPQDQPSLTLHRNPSQMYFFFSEKRNHKTDSLIPMLSSLKQVDSDSEFL